MNSSYITFGHSSIYAHIQTLIVASYCIVATAGKMGKCIAEGHKRDRHSSDLNQQDKFLAEPQFAQTFETSDQLVNHIKLK